MTKKTLWLLCIVAAMAVGFTGCKKTNDDSDSPTASGNGKCVMSDTTVSFTKCYSMPAPYFLQEYFLMFVPSNMTITGLDSTGFKSGSSGKGTMFLLIVKVPAGNTGVVVGDYTIQSEPEYRVPFNFDGAIYMHANLSEQHWSDWGELELAHDIILHVTQTNGVISFSASGKVEGNKDFTFNYSGPITKL